jgi:hypothetical protein
MHTRANSSSGPCDGTSDLASKVLSHWKSESSTFAITYRRSVRMALGLPPDSPIFMAGNQPYFLGGLPKSIAKLVALEHLRRLLPGSKTAFRFLFSDAARSNPLMYRTLLPSHDKHIRIGMSRRQLSSDIPIDCIPFTTARAEAVTNALALNGWGPVLPFWVHHQLGCSFGDLGTSLAAYNAAFLRRLAIEFNIEPSYWLYDGAVETAIAASEFWPIFTVN